MMKLRFSGILLLTLGSVLALGSGFLTETPRSAAASPPQLLYGHDNVDIDPAPSLAPADNKVSACGTVLDVPGDYVLTTNLVCGASPPTFGVAIIASNVHFNLAGHSITGPGPGPFKAGIRVGVPVPPGSPVTPTPTGTNCVPTTGVQIQNGTVSGFNAGIELRCADNGRVNGMTLTGNVLVTTVPLFGGDGLRLVDGSDGNQINANNLSGNERSGAIVSASHNSRFNNNVISGNGTPVACALVYCGGIYLLVGYRNSVPVAGTGSMANVVQSNQVSGNRGVGIQVDGFSSGNTVRGNTVNNTLGPTPTAATATRPGIIINGDNNIVQDNTSNNNSHGIFLICDATDVPVTCANNNKVGSNTTNNNSSRGIQLNLGATANRVQSNTALNNASHDLADFNTAPACDNNTWVSNTFVTKNATCIN